MADLQFSTALRNARGDATEVAIGASPIIKIRSGAKPANPAAADSGVVLATIPCPADWLLAAAGGTKSKSGAWDDNAADNTGIAGHFRVYAADGVTCHIQGSVTAGGGGGSMTVDNVNFNAGQAFSITGFSITEGNL